MSKELDFNNILLQPELSNYTSRKEVNLETTFHFPESGQSWTGIPIMAANMDGVGTIEMALVLQEFKMITTLVKTTTVIPDTLNPEYYSVSTGIGASDYARLKKFLEDYPDTKFITVDVANGYMQAFVDFVAKLRKEYPTKVIIAGNVVSYHQTMSLYAAGADIVRCGIGPGSVCTTRIQTGVGRPQFTAVQDCSKFGTGVHGKIVSDGGCTCPGDVAKAFVAGASFVMLGGLLAGHDEGGGKIVTKYKETQYLDESGLPIIEEEKTVQFYGMSSDTAMNKTHGGVAEYRSSEGRTVEIPYRGPVKETVQNILGGLRSAATYTNVVDFSDWKDVHYVEVTNQFNRIFV